MLLPHAEAGEYTVYYFFTYAAAVKLTERANGKLDIQSRNVGTSPDCRQASALPAGTEIAAQYSFTSETSSREPSIRIRLADPLTQMPGPWMSTSSETTYHLFDVSSRVSVVTLRQFVARADAPPETRR